MSLIFLIIGIICLVNFSIGWGVFWVILAYLSKD